jgi:hypothetical protein
VNKVADPYGDVALEKLIHIAAARLRAEKSDVTRQLHKFTLEDLQIMGASAEAGEVSDFSSEFLGACVWLQVGAEIKRRMEALHDGSMSAEEVLGGVMPLASR